MKILAAKWVQLEIILLGETSQSPQDRHLPCSVIASTQSREPRKEISRGRSDILRYTHCLPPLSIFLGKVGPFFFPTAECGNLYLRECQACDCEVKLKYGVVNLSEKKKGKRRMSGECGQEAKWGGDCHETSGQAFCYTHRKS